MLIENPDAFKTWLTSILEPLCDADPAALAKYVYALVKKEKPLDDLREGMIDQLDVFLQQDTKPFVDMLFKSLETQDYIKSAEKEVSIADEAKEATVAPEPEQQPVEHASNGISEEHTSPPPSLNRHRTVVSRQAPKVSVAAPRPVPAEQTLVKLLPLNELLEEPIDMPRRRDRRDNIRDKEDRRRRRSRSWDRGPGGPGGPAGPGASGGRPAGPGASGGAPGPRGRRRWREGSPPHERRYDKRRLASKSPSPARGRYRNRSPPASGDRPLSRSRSRSPMPLRDLDRERDRLRVPREIERDRVSRERDHMDRVSRSRDRERDRVRSRSRSRSAGTPTQENHEPNNVAHNQFKRRCRDFDERGFCVRGDLCQWDHGLDPLVLDQTTMPPNLSRVLDMVPNVPEYNPLAPDIWGGGYQAYPTLPPRELVPIPRLREAPPPARPPPPPHPAPHKNNKKIFDYNRLGSMRPMGPNAANCSLEVKKVPFGMNDITHLNNHFSKFGKIVNIQVCFEGDPEAALITFSNHTEANVAYKSTEAVLNNRFIKVFWRNNNESKQENVPPSGMVANKPERHPNMHPNSLNKVLINKDNMKVTAENKLNDEKAKKELEEAKSKEPGPEREREREKEKNGQLQYERGVSLLNSQLRQQKLLILRMESENVTEAQKKEIMAAISSSQAGIEKLQKELCAYNKAKLAAQGESVAHSLGRLQLSQTRKPKTREEVQKEILDAELDLFTKQQEGLDVTELLKKVAEMRRQMAVQFPTHAVSRRLHSRGGRFSTVNNRFAKGAAPAQPKVFVNQSVDHRPRALLVSGFEADELDSVLKHFAQFGEIVGREVNTAVPELIVQYRVRAHAEQAIVKAKHYNDRTLSITWVMNNKPITPVAPPAAADDSAADVAEMAAAVKQNGADVADNKVEKNEANEQTANKNSEDTLLRFDEEEEEDNEEDRSWRR